MVDKKNGAGFQIRAPIDDNTHTAHWRHRCSSQVEKRTNADRAEDIPFYDVPVPQLADNGIRNGSSSIMTAARTSPHG